MHLTSVVFGRPTSKQIACSEKVISDERNKLACMHPDAPDECSAKIIKAHTISRSLNLKPIAHDHKVVTMSRPSVFELDKTNGVIQLEPMPIKKASTFTGFCGKHDNELFSEIEDQVFHATKRQVALLMFRTICKEIRAKESTGKFFEAFKIAYPEPNKKYADAWNAWNAMSTFPFNFGWSSTIGKNDLIKTEQVLEELLFENGVFSKLNALVVEYPTGLPFSISGIASPEHTLSGKQFQNLTDPDLKVFQTFHHIIHRTDGSALFILSWLSNHNCPSHLFIEEIASELYSTPGGLLLEYLASYNEEIYYSPTWFDSLSENQKAKLHSWCLRNTLSESGYDSEPIRPANSIEFNLGTPSTIYSPI